MRGPLACALGLAVVAAGAHAQRIDRGPGGVVRPLRDSPAVRNNVGRARWWAVAASGVVPGSGQAVLGQDRFVGYLAVEAYTWVQYVTDLRAGRRDRSAYRELALRVARAPFGGTAPNGDFEYYESMERYAESGAYDATPGGSVDPETDVATFNGATWLLARQTYWSDPNVAPPPDSPQFDSALVFYRRRAVRDAYRWSWRNAPLEQDVFRRTISRSNSAFRQSVNDLGVVLANHVLSTIDAYISIRMTGRHAAVASFTF